jgi:hypothetical protein
MPKLSNIDAQVLMREIYDTVYRVHDHVRQSSALALVAMHSCEQLEDDYLLRKLLTDYIDYQIYEYFHLALNEYIDMPSYYRKQLHKITSSRIEEKQKMMEDIESGFKDERNITR